MNRSPGYRPDIDGLRAVAILLVLFYHAGFEFVSGGFVGVDVFFVISGYLITGIIARRHAAGSFRLRHFYTRRILRLLPAFYAVAFASSAAAFLILLPHELEAYATSLLSAIFFSSNFYFASVTDGYFASQAEILPLLHTWSLAVEEQFYLIWPFAFIALLRRRSSSSLKWWLSLSMVASFVAAEIAVRGHSDAAYYAPWSRAGELLMGALLAIHHMDPEQSSLAEAVPIPPSSSAETWATAVGLALIAGSATLLDGFSRFPGVHALWPCLGAAILIHVGRGEASFARRILGFRPLVFVGLISYALYLWHWPILAFARALRLDAGAITTGTLIALSFVFAVLTWRFIERPIRAYSGMALRQALIRIFAPPALTLTALALMILAGHGFESRFSPEILNAVQQTLQSPNGARGVCIALDEVELPPEAECRLGAVHDGVAADEGDPDALLWGDSIANHYAGFFDEVGLASGIELRDVTMAGCPPLLGSQRLERKKGPLCRRRNDEVMDLIREGDFTTVYLGGYWAFYLDRDGFLGDDVDMTRDRENARRVLSSSLRRTVSSILDAHKSPVILRNVPKMDFDASLCAIKNEIHPPLLSRDCRMKISKHRDATREVDEIMDALESEFPTLRILSVTDLLCSGEFCLPDLEGVTIYRAGFDDHLNMAGSRALGRAYLDLHGPLSSPAAAGDTSRVRKNPRDG